MRFLVNLTRRPAEPADVAAATRQLAPGASRTTRIAMSAALVLAVALASVAAAGSGSPTVLPVEPDGAIGTSADAEGLPLPVEPDGGIGTSTDADDLPLPVEPDGGIGN